ncbi:hypothetical protein AGMMS49938_11290 [Fibrobacterales bacterium]|nr:hypothetical protein AGMMS49938_11290 [Fibrobacterales bacterium]
MRAGTAWEPSIKNDILWLLQNASEDDAIAVYADATYAYEYYKHQVGNNHSYFVYGAPAANEPLNVFGWRMDIPKEAEKQISKAQVQQKQKIFFLSERISLDEFLFINYLSIHYDVVCLNEKINLCVIELDSGI